MVPQSPQQLGRFRLTVTLLVRHGCWNVGEAGGGGKEGPTSKDTS